MITCLKCTRDIKKVNIVIGSSGENLPAEISGPVILLAEKSSAVISSAEISSAEISMPINVQAEISAAEVSYIRCY